MEITAKPFEALDAAKQADGLIPAIIQDARTLRVLMLAVATFMGRYPFCGVPVVLLDKPMKLPGDVFLGVKFFSAFRVVFDFRHGRLWLRLAD